VRRSRWTSWTLQVRRTTLPSGTTTSGRAKASSSYSQSPNRNHFYSVLNSGNYHSWQPNDFSSWQPIIIITMPTTVCRDQILRVKQSDSSSALLPPLILVGNKSDLSADRRKVEQPYALSKSKSWAIPYTETSAKTKENVDKVFFDLLRVIRDRKNVNNKGNKNNKNHHHAAAAANAAAASANATQRQESICSKLFGSWLPGCR
jgi:hypothetical protein